jgi:hypothetical protein
LGLPSAPRSRRRQVHLAAVDGCRPGREHAAGAGFTAELLAPDFHEFGASGGEIGYAGTAELVARSTDPDGDPIKVEHMRGQLLADGLVMVKYTSENHGRWSNRTSLWRRTEAGHWQIFHHQGTITGVR